MLEQPQAGLIGRFYRQVKNRPKKNYRSNNKGLETKFMMKNDEIKDFQDCFYSQFVLLQSIEGFMSKNSVRNSFKLHFLKCYF